MVQRLEKWEMHNPATLRCQMPSSHLACVCVCVWVCILTPVCKHNGLKVLHFTSRLFIFFPLCLFFLPSFACCIYFFLQFLFIFFFLQRSGPRMVVGVSYYSVLDTSTSSGTHACTHCPVALSGCLWLRLMVKLHRLLFYTIVLTLTYLGRWYENGRLAWGVGIGGTGCQQLLGDSGRQGVGNKTSLWLWASQKCGFSLQRGLTYYSHIYIH